MPWGFLPKLWNTCTWPLDQGLQTLRRGQYCHVKKCIKRDIFLCTFTVERDELNAFVIISFSYIVKFTAHGGRGWAFLLRERGKSGHKVNMYVLGHLSHSIVVGRALQLFVNNSTLGYGTQVTVNAYRPFLYHLVVYFKYHYFDFLWWFF